MRVMQHTRSLERAPTRDRPIESVAKPVGHFLLHYVEMCAVMCVSGVLLSVLFFQTAVWLGYSNLPQTAPELSVLVIALNLSVPMAAWMRFRGMDWRPTLEMAGATMATGFLLIAGYWLDLLAASALVEIQVSLACPVMLGVMLLRFRLYSSGHKAHHAHAS